MEAREWQQQHHERFATLTPGAFPMAEVPMKGVILANRKTIFHKTRVCPRLTTGSCHLGNKCSFAHSPEELRPAPNLDKTKLCPSVLHPGTPCPARLRGEGCRFAHSKAEIRHTTNMYKTNMCLKWIRGKCKKELQCNHAHGHQELKYYRSLAMASGARDFARESLAGTARKKKSLVGSNSAPNLVNLPALLFANRQHLQRQASGERHFQPHGSVSGEALLQLLQQQQQQKRRQQQLQQQQNGNCASVDGKALVALRDKLVRQATDVQGKSFSFSNHDDSTSATDESSDFSSFSSFSSRTLSDAFRSAASTGASCVHASEWGLGRPSLLGGAGLGRGSSSSSNWEGPSDVERLLLMKVWGEEEGGNKHCLLRREGGKEERHEAWLPEVLSPAVFAAESIPEFSCMQATTKSAAAAADWGALEASLATLCLADPALGVPSCYTEPPPGFELKLPQQQEQEREHGSVSVGRGCVRGEEEEC
ncbi:hypothetical protein Esti_003724 [Eimeria stiedai]